MLKIKNYPRSVRLRAPPPLTVPLLTESDKIIASQFDGNCAPISITVLVNQPYTVIHNCCEMYGWDETDGLPLIDMLMVIYEFGCRVKNILGKDNNTTTLAKAKKYLLNKERKYLIYVDGHVLASVNGIIVDTYRCAGQTKVYQIFEVIG